MYELTGAAVAAAESTSIDIQMDDDDVKHVITERHRTAISDRSCRQTDGRTEGM